MNFRRKSNECETDQAEGLGTDQPDSSPVEHQAGSHPPDVAIFKASTGPEGLEIRCENDWFNHNGRIKLTIANVDGGSPIIRYYHPDTLNRDYVAEQAEKEDEAKQARKEWVWVVGKEMAHKLVDQYWGG